MIDWGHILGGTFYIFFGLTLAFKTSYRYFFAGVHHALSKKRCSRFRWDIIEAILLIIATTSGIFYEQEEVKFHLTEASSGKFSGADVWAHTTMYAFFIIFAVTSILVIMLPKTMPHCLHHFTMALALAVEGTLLHFHIHGRAKLDRRLHFLLTLAIWPVTVMVIILWFIDNNENLANAYTIRPETAPRVEEIRCNEVDSNVSLLQNQNDTAEPSEPGAKQNTQREDHKTQKSHLKKIFTIQLGVAVGMITQGMMLCEIASVLYPSNGKPWKQNSDNVKFITMFFAWFIALAMFIVGTIFWLVGIVRRVKYHDCGI